MWVSFPGLRGWWRSQAEKCPRSPRGEAGHSMLHVRAVEAPVCGGRTVSTSCWGSGVGGGGCKPQHGGPMGSGREVSLLGPRGPLLCWRLPRWDPMVWPGSSSGSFGMASGPLAIARTHSTSPTGLCHCRLFGTWAYMAALCQWLVRPVCWSPPWCVSHCRVNLGPAPLPFAIFCPPTLSRAGPGGVHVPPAFSRWSAFAWARSPQLAAMPVLPAPLKIWMIKEEKIPYLLRLLYKCQPICWFCFGLLYWILEVPFLPVSLSKTFWN